MKVFLLRAFDHTDRAKFWKEKKQHFDNFDNFDNVNSKKHKNKIQIIIINTQICILSCLDTQFFNWIEPVIVCSAHISFHLHVDTFFLSAVLFGLNNSYNLPNAARQLHISFIIGQPDCSHFLIYKLFFCICR